jgi:hypothetical protein
VSLSRRHLLFSLSLSLLPFFITFLSLFFPFFPSFFLPFFLCFFFLFLFSSFCLLSFFLFVLLSFFLLSFIRPFLPSPVPLLCVDKTPLPQAAEDAKYTLGLQTDFAMLGETGGGCSLRYEYWLGKVCRLTAVYKNGRKQDWKDPVDLRTLPTTCQLHVIAQWYKQKLGGSRGESMYTLSDLSDYTLYHAKHVIMPLQLDLCEKQTVAQGIVSEAVYKLDRTDMRALDQHIKEMTMQVTNSGRQQNVQRTVRGREEDQAVQHSAVKDVEGYNRITGERTRSGRKTTKVCRTLVTL